MPPSTPRSDAPSATLERPALAASLGPWLKLLWDDAPALRLCAEEGPGAVPHLDADALVLPPLPPGRMAVGPRARLSWQQACAAHAAAHRIYSAGIRFTARGLVPITRALIGLLEDVRVEALAMRELPGLRRLWAPWHVATPDDGDDLEALLGRLAHALIDPDYQDPHPWIAKGRALVWVDTAQTALALRQAADLRRVASRLGHDLGQMRLGFNARQYRPAPAYRDDHRWLWDDAMPAPVEATPDEALPDAAAEAAATSVSGAVLGERHYPEWDRLIARLRPRWCRVVEREPQADTDARPSTPGQRDAARRYRQALPTRAWRRGRGRVVDGDRLDLDAAIDRALQRRAGVSTEDRVYHDRDGVHEPGTTLVLIDTSASTATPLRTCDGTPARRRPGSARAGTATILDAARDVAATLATAAGQRGDALAIQGFSSDGRHAVSVQRVKDYAQAWDATARGRLAALRSGQSTRLGAAIRHAAHGLAQRPGARRTLVVLTDGEAHDIDLHDPRYLVADARQAVAQARRAGVRVVALALGPADRVALRRVFGAAHSRVVGHAAAGLPVLARWLG